MTTMPIYQYECTDCGQTFELLVRSDTIPQCSHCGSQQLRKCVTAPSAPGKSAAIIKANRKRAAAEGHLSNYSAADKRKV